MSVYAIVMVGRDSLRRSPGYKTLQNNVNAMEWPSKSPDLSPIEQAWDMLDRRVRQRRVQPQTLLQLQQALVQEWNNIPINVIRRYLRSMRRRCRVVIQSARGATQGTLLC